MKKANVALMSLSMLALVVMARGAQTEDFKHTLNLGVTLTDGNSETLLANAALLSEGAKEGLGSVRAGLEANYGESTIDDRKETTVENARAFGNIKHTISPRTFTYLDGQAAYDDIAAIDYRVTIGPGLGFYPVKNETTALFLEAGPAYLWEKVDNVTDDYLGVRFAERFTHALSATAGIWQSAEYVPKADDFSDYLLTVEIGAEATMNQRLNLRLVLRNTHDSSPGRDMEKNDLAMIAGIGITL